MEKKKKRVIFSLLAAIGVGVFSFAGAQSPVPTGATVEQLRTANITNAQLLFRENKREIDVYFDISNMEGTQAGIRYGLLLGKKENSSFSVVLREMFPQKISISQNETLPIRATLSVPSYLKGEHEVAVFIQDESGMVFAQVGVGKVNLNGDGKFVEINNCRLLVDVSLENGKMYSISQGVDILPEEKLKVSCQVANHLGRDVVTLPYFENHLRNFSGDVVEAEKIDQEILNLKTGESRKLELFVPRAQKPQAYDAVFSLKSEDGKNFLSNSLPLHYVLRGKSATVQALKLDKDGYRQGDTATLTFFWSGAADSFNGARYGSSLNNGEQKYLADISIKKKSGETCSNSSGNALDIAQRKAEIKMSIKEECPNPIVSFIIKDSEGNVLVQKDYAVETRGEFGKETPSEQPQKENNDNSFFNNISLWLKIIVIGLSILGLILVVIKWKKGRSALIAIFALSGLFLSSELVMADIFSIVNYFPMPACYMMSSSGCGGAARATCDCYRFCVLGENISGFSADCSPVVNTSSQEFYVNLNKTLYSPGETITASGGASAEHSCLNTPEGIKKLSLFGYQDGNKGELFDVDIDWDDRMGLDAFGNPITFWGSNSSYAATLTPNPDPKTLYSIDMEGCNQAWVRNPSAPVPAGSPYHADSPLACNTSGPPNSGKTFPLYYRVTAPDNPERVEVEIRKRYQQEDGTWANWYLTGRGSIQLQVDGAYYSTVVFDGGGSAIQTIPGNFVGAGGGTVTPVDMGDMEMIDEEVYRPWIDTKLKYNGYYYETGLSCDPLADGGSCRVVVVYEEVPRTEPPGDDPGGDRVGNEAFKICPNDTYVLEKNTTYVNAYYWDDYTVTGNACDHKNDPGVAVVSCAVDSWALAPGTYASQGACDYPGLGLLIKTSSVPNKEIKTETVTATYTSNKGGTDHILTDSIDLKVTSANCDPDSSWVPGKPEDVCIPGSAYNTCTKEDKPGTKDCSFDYVEN